MSALLRAISSSSRFVAALPKVARLGSRAFASKAPAEFDGGKVWDDVDGLTGRARTEAIFKRVYGKEYFNKEAPTFFEEGTRENPIPILSNEEERLVGITLPDEAEIRWMILRRNELAYDPDTCNYFALKYVSQEEVAEWAKRAEDILFPPKGGSA